MIDPTDPSGHPGPLDPELRALVDDALSLDAVDPAFEEPARERVLGRVERVINQAPRAARGGFGLRTGVMAVSVALIATLAGGRLLREDAGSPSDTSPTAIAPQPVADHPSVSPATVSASALPPGDAVPTMRIDELPSPPPSLPARSSRTDSPRGAAPSGTDLAEEYRLVEGARAKLAARDYTAALQSIREHEKRFPSGQLDQERESLHIQNPRRNGAHPGGPHARGALPHALPERPSPPDRRASHCEQHAGLRGSLTSLSRRQPRPSLLISVLTSGCTCSPADTGQSLS